MCGCRRHADQPHSHGPYYQSTAKLDGRTVIANARDIATQATNLNLDQV